MTELEYQYENALRALLARAQELREVLELEISGARDGDGYWHGSDVLGETWTDVRKALDRVQCACRQCNQAKGDSVPVAQAEEGVAGVFFKKKIISGVRSGAQLP